MLPTTEQLELSLVLGDTYGTRFQDKNWREVRVRPTTGGIHIDPFLPSWNTKCGHCGAHVATNTFELVRDTITLARQLGYEAWMCDDDPRNGGWIQENQ